VGGIVLLAGAAVAGVALPTAAATAPSAPRGLVVTAGPASNRVALTWTAPASTGGGKITNYGYAKSTDGGATFSAISWFNSTATSRTSDQVAGLKCTTRSNQKGCRYRVVARSSAGIGGPSNVVTSWVVPGAPGNLRGTINADFTTASPKWDRPAQTGGFATLTYRILRSVDGGAYAEVATTTSLGASVGCAGATSCAYKVLASNAQGSGPATSALSFGVAPSAVVGLSIANIGSDLGTGGSTLKTTWSRPTSGLAVARYEVQQCTTPADASTACASGWGPVKNIAADKTQRTSTCAAGAATCSVMVRAVNTRGGAGPPAIVTLRPWAPFEVTTAPADPGKVTVRFRGPNDAGTGTPRSYSVFVCAAACSSASSWSDAGLSVGYPRTDAAPHTAGSVACAGTCQVRMQFNAGATKSLLTPATSGTGGPAVGVSIASPADGARTAADPVAFSGACTGTAGGTVTVVVHDSTLRASGPCPSDGTWSASLTALANGTYAVHAEQVAPGGSASSPTRTLVVDRTAAAEVTAAVVADGLQYPAMFGFDAGGRIFYSELKTGGIRILDPATGATSLFTTVSDLCTAGDQGLFGVAPHPAYPSTRTVYAYATRLVSGTCHNQLLRLTGSDPLVAAAGAPTTEVLFDQAYLGEHIGGRLVFGPDGLLYLSTGEGGPGEGGPSAAHSQDPTSGHGKILRFAADGSAPPSNPVSGSAVYALGFRNVFGMAFDPANGSLWATENGPACNDEIDRIVAGGNYGWGPNATCLTPPSAPTNTNRDGPSPIPPAFWYSPSNGPTGVTFCAGCGLGPAMEGKLLFGQWQDGQIHALTLDASRTGVLGDALVYGHPTAETPLSLETAPDGTIYFSNQRGIYRLRLAPEL
jgi:glucose/arabinose dehydrogenase